MKHLRVLTAGSNIYTTLTSKVKDKVVKTDHYIVTKNNWDNIKLNLSYKPLFSPYYVIEVYMTGIDKAMLKDIMSILKEGYVQAIFICSSFKDYEQLEQCDNLDILSFNGYQPPDKVMFQYVQERLSFKLEISFFREIQSRLRGNYDLVDSYLDKLNENPPKDLTELKKIVPRLSKTGLWRFFTEMLEGKNPNLVYKVVSDYEFGGKFLLDYINNCFDSLLKLYPYYSKGKFNQKTIKAFGSKQGDLLKSLGLKEYQLEGVLAIYKTHSLSELLIRKEVIDRILKDARTVGYSYSLYQAVATQLNLKSYARTEDMNV